MDGICEAAFQNLSIAKNLADDGFLEPFLKLCGGLEIDDEDGYGIALMAISAVFPGICGYYNQEIEVDTIVIFDPLIDELYRLLQEYEALNNIKFGESDLRLEVNRDIYRSFDLFGYNYDYSFRVYDVEHGRKRLVFLSGIEFCGFQELPGAFADVYRTIEGVVRRLRRELGIEPTDDPKAEKEAA